MSLCPKLIRSNIKLTIGMLVSNQKEYIRKAMEGLKPLLEAVPSELIVVDTVGAEHGNEALAIVREYTDKIYHFAWCDDFAAARNVCFDHAVGEWFMFQDDDEWFEDVQELIDFFISGECEQYNFGYHYIRNYLSDGSFSTALVGRLIRRTEETRFVGRVHEHFNQVYEPKKEFSCFSHHMGYAYSTEEKRAEKQKRNIAILKAEIAERGYSPQRAAQLVQELLVREETREEGYRICQESVDTMEELQVLGNPFGQWLLTAMVRYYCMKQELEQVIAEGEKILTRYPLSQTAKMVLAAAVVPVASNIERYDIVEKYCDLYLENWDWKIENPEESLQQITLDFPEYLTDIYYYNMVHMAAATANYKGDYRRAFSYWKRLPLGQEGFDSVRFAPEMNRTLQGLKSL